MFKMSSFGTNAGTETFAPRKKCIIDDALSPSYWWCL